MTTTYQKEDESFNLSELKEDNVPMWTVIPPQNVNMIKPCAHTTSREYILEYNGEALWHWRKLNLSYPNIYLKAMNESLRPLGYEISDKAHRVGAQLKTTSYRFNNKVGKMNTQTRKKTISTSWFKVMVREDELSMIPENAIKKKEEEVKELQEKLYQRNESLKHQRAQVLELLEEGLRIKQENDTLRKDFKNKGKKIQEVQYRQKNRKIQQIGEQASSVLWFSETFGLTPKSLTVMEQENGIEHKITLSNDTTPKLPKPQSIEPTGQMITDPVHGPAQGNENASATYTDPVAQAPQTPPQQRAKTSNEKSDNISPTRKYRIQKFLSLGEEEREKVMELTSILNKFGVSFESYHELTQIPGNNSMTRSYLLEGCQGHLDSKWNITKTPGCYGGAELNFQELLQDQLREHLEREQKPDAMKERTFKVKISGDGAALTKKSNLMVCSFSIIDDSKNMMSSAGNHTIAVVQTSESYDNLKISLSNVIKDVNKIQKQGYIEVDNNKVKVELFLGGDYKFLLLCLGMKAANSTHACIYCKVSIEERQDMSKPVDYFYSTVMAKKLHDNWHKDPGCQKSPLFDIPLDHCTVDELHALLRITDRLEHALIYDAVDWDEEENFGVAKKNQKQTHLNNLLHAVHTCGVGFQVWHDKDNKLDWTSLMGDDKKKLLRNLPSKFPTFVRPTLLTAVTKLWKANEWAKLLLSMRSEGYNWTNPITPYIHIMVYHMPKQLEWYGSIKEFTGQGVEKKNDVMRRAFHRSINRWDACKSLLLVDKRQESLQTSVRRKRPYKKLDNYFWDKGGKLSVAGKYKRISRAVLEPIETENLPQTTRPIMAEVIHTEDSLKQMKNSQLRDVLHQLNGEIVNKRTRRNILIDTILTTQSKE